MENNRNIERVYDLLEQFDFSDLSNKNQKFILSVITEKEYVQMRQTLGNATNYYDSAKEPIAEEHVKASIMKSAYRSNRVVRLIKKPIPLYQLAASILILVGLFFVYTNYVFHSNTENTLAQNDTIVIHKTDTIYSKVTDTIRVVVEKLVYVTPNIKDTAQIILAASEKNKTIIREWDCSRDLCPGDLQKIRSMNTNNRISMDSVLKGFVVSLN